MALDASLHHGKSKNEQAAAGLAGLLGGGAALPSNDNDYYVQRASGASSGMPLSMMAFNNNNDFGEDALTFGYLVQTTDKQVIKVSLEEADSANPFFTEELLFTTAHLYSKMQAALISGKEVVVGITQTLRLYLNGHLFSNEATCFGLHENFLLFVNSTSGLMHELFIYDMDKRLPRPQAQGLSLGETSAEEHPPVLASMEEKGGNFNVRAVERGTRIVVTNGYKTILQMPRGNLEGIQPRILLLKTVVRLIKKTRFGMAFKLLRQHKLDINLLYDVDPEKFLSNMGKFVKQVKKVDYLNLFVNSLSNNERSRELDFMFPEQEDDRIQKEHDAFMLKF